MNIKKLKNPLLLTLTALIWGVAFVAQKSGGNSVGTFCITGLRSIIASVVLLPVIAVMSKRKSETEIKRTASKKTLIIGGICCGTCLFAASALQQYGIAGTEAGKAGFITSLYIVIVPIIGTLFLKKHSNLRMWISVFIAVVGMYFLCVTKGLGISVSDLILLCCAVIFAVHILVIDHFSPQVDGVKMSCIQFLTCGILSFIFMIITGEKNSIEAILSAWLPILYLGAASNGIANTLQVVAQNDIDPTLASMIMSLESVFAVLAGTIFGERLSLREGLGCIIMFTAIVLAQLPKRKKYEDNIFGI